MRDQRSVGWLRRVLACNKSDGVGGGCRGEVDGGGRREGDCWDLWQDHRQGIEKVSFE